MKEVKLVSFTSRSRSGDQKSSNGAELDLEENRKKTQEKIRTGRRLVF